jgi:hypothetical protein
MGIRSLIIRALVIPETAQKCNNMQTSPGGFLKLKMLSWNEIDIRVTTNL